MRTAILAAAVAVCLSTAAIAQPPKPGAARPIGPCSLLTKADVQEAVELEPEDGTPNPTNLAGCDYKFGDGGNLSVSVPKGGPDVTPEKVIAQLNKRGVKTVEATGIGDSAFYAAMGYGMVQLNAFKGAKYVIVTLLVPGADEAKTKAIAEKLMRRALSRF